MRIPEHRLPLLLALGAALTVGAALLFEHGFGYAPCKLCHWQRVPYYAAIPLFLLPLLFGPRLIAPTLALFAALFLADAAIAAYHVGVEQSWWKGPATCTALDFGSDPAAVLRRIMDAPVVRCDEIAWTFLGLSMAFWNMIIALGLAAGALFGLMGKRKKT
ncbi:MAG: disulfide bond formation protein B [Rhodothalassiaceae bacterium]